MVVDVVYPNKFSSKQIVGSEFGVLGTIGYLTDNPVFTCSESCISKITTNVIVISGECKTVPFDLGQHYPVVTHALHH